jgi:pimeloyl-ACP methyl ester carboxylesterase
MKPLLKIIIAFFLLIGLTSLVLSEGEGGYFIYLRGKKQYVLVEGKGEPTIVFLTGKGRPQNDFKRVYNKIKRTNQIFSYDRAGLGESEAFKNERTIDTMAYELHELLVKEKIKPPYILVGHSLGGHIMRCFVSMYPNTVSGMVFVDPAQEDEFKNGLALRNDSEKVVFREQYKSYLKFPGRTKGHNAESKHCFDFDSTGYATNQRIVKDLKLPTNIPITVLLSTQPDVENAYIERELEYRTRFFENWKTLNSQTKVITTSKSGHFIHVDEPSLVIDEINEVIGKVKIK